MAGTRPQRGFTLTELLVSIALLALLLATGVPSLRSFTANQQIRAASFDLLSDLMLSRSESLKRSREVRLLPRDGNWANGWSIVSAADGEVLATREPLGRGVRMTRAPSRLTFGLGGQAVGVLGVVRFGLEADAYDGPALRCISLDPSGRPRVVREACP